nr:hypothetical protein CFP56_24480 [Quercus suber]
MASNRRFGSRRRSARRYGSDRYGSCLKQLLDLVDESWSRDVSISVPAFRALQGRQTSVKYRHRQLDVSKVTRANLGRFLADQTESPVQFWSAPWCEGSYSLTWLRCAGLRSRCSPRNQECADLAIVMIEVDSSAVQKVCRFQLRRCVAACTLTASATQFPFNTPRPQRGPLPHPTPSV